MHFGKQLKQLIYEPWKECYVDWRRLKHAIRALQRKHNPTAQPFSSSPPSSSTTPSTSSTYKATEGETQPLLEAGAPRMLIGTIQDTVPLSASMSSLPTIINLPIPREDLDKFLEEFVDELKRIEGFFLAQLQLAEIKRRAASGMVADRKNRPHPDTLIKKTLFDALLIAEELTDFARLNLVGFTKLANKFVKHTGFDGSEALARRIAESAFVSELPKNDTLKDAIKATYSEAFPQPFERNIGSSASVRAENSSGDSVQELVQSVSAARSWKRNTILVEFDNYQKRATMNETKKGKAPWPIALAFVTLLFVYFVPMFPSEDRAAQRCLGIVIAATILWVSECLPLFITSLSIPLLVTLSYVLLDSSSGTPLSPKDSAKLMFNQMFPSNIPLILAGFSIAQAFAKYGLDTKIALLVLKKKFWRTPHRFLMAIELLTFVMSMFISNVASTVLLITISMPVIRGLPKRSVYAKTILLATAVAGNIGGMTTQIASPQNAVSAGLGEYSVDFIKFSIISLPLCPFLLVLGHLLVIKLFPPDIKELPKLDLGGSGNGDTPKNDVERAAKVLYNKKGHIIGETRLDIIRKWWESQEAKQISILVISGISIILWTTSPWLKPFGCSIGIISLVPILLFYGFNLLGKQDFEALPWTLTTLIAGGNALGYAVESSELLDIAASVLLRLPDSMYLVSIVSCLIMMIAGSFVSHTVAALILLRLFAHVGEAMGHAKLLVMTSIIMDCGSMPLPISSFPNINSFSVETSDGEPYLKTSDFLKIGIPCTILSFIGSNTITYAMSLLFHL